jgi:carboxyl-terminal processing protease
MQERLKLSILFLSTLVVAYGLIGGLLEKVTAGEDPYRDLSVFTKVLDHVQRDYVEQPDVERALRGSLHGMMDSLDPFSSFVARDTYQRFADQDYQAGAGLVLSKRYGYAHIVAVTEGSPADKNGLRSGDLIESIDGNPTVLMSLWEAEHRLRGDEDTTVELRIIRSRPSKPQTVVLKRAAVESPDVAARIAENELGIVEVPGLREGTSGLVRSKLNMLLATDVKGILIDLRGAAEGQVQEAVAVADLFLPEGAEIGKVRSRVAVGEEFVSFSPPQVTELPVVLLVDGGTSGAAEVLTAALKDNGVAEVVGQRTNGHGSTQEAFELKDGSVLLMSTKLFERPDGSLIQNEELRKSGVNPDLRSPSQDFITSFYFDNSPDDLDAELDEDFYQRLDESIKVEQFDSAVQHLKEKIRENREYLEEKAA